MKKLDLHIHTVLTPSDNPFVFSLMKLKEYVTSMQIDCIAITNHNTFDRTNFEEIKKALSIVVLPGIEIDLEGGHILLIANDDDLNDFTLRCGRVENAIKSSKDISVEEMKSIFQDLSKYILIPHYDKRPYVRPEVLAKLSEHVSAGEVTSVRKFKACLKDKETLVPVIFSDMRPDDKISSYPVRQTFVDLDAVTWSGIKACLFDKNKVFLSVDGGNDLFQATDDGIKLSTGLNVMFGERSTGKTFTLERISESVNNVKYIRQFSLLQNDASKFEELMSMRNSSVSETFLTEFKQVVNDIAKVDLKQNDLDVEHYLDSLLKYALENDKADTFSKAVLFSESAFAMERLNRLQELIDATVLLIDNTEYADLIARHVAAVALKNLVVDLIVRYRQVSLINKKKTWVNTLVKKIKDELKFQTATSPPAEIDLYKVMLEQEKVRKFNRIVAAIKQRREVQVLEIRSFKLVVYARPFENASALKETSGRKVAFTDAFTTYDAPYEFLRVLMAIDLPETDYYKYFVDFEYKTLNRHGFPVSGGERSEFNLLHEISDALKYDLLLLDEPESSFDNLFLKNEVNELIREISRSIPVIVVTHNSTVGASVKPDYILYSERTLTSGGVQYCVYTGYPHSKVLTSSDGKMISNFDVMLNCLEAGSETYNERRTKNYEILKN